MKKCVLLIIVLANLLGACATPAATVPPIATPSAPAQPSAIHTETPSPTFTPEPTAVPEAFVINDSGQLTALNPDTGAYEPILDVNGANVTADTLVPTEVKLNGETVTFTTAMLGGVPQAMFNPTTGEYGVLTDGEARFMGRSWRWDAETKEMIPWIELNSGIPGRTVFGSPEMTYNLEMSPDQGQEIHQKLIEMFRTAKALTEYRQALMGNPNPSEAEFEAFLQGSFGPNGEPYWLPGEVKGVKLVIAESGRAKLPYPHFGSNPALASGIALDFSRLAVYDADTYWKTPGFDGYFSDLRSANAGTRGSTISEIGMGEMGLLVTPDHHVLWISASQANPREGMFRVAFTNYLWSGVDRCFVPPIVTAQLETYEAVFKTYTNQDGNLKICVNTPLATDNCTGFTYPEDVAGSETLVSLNASEAAACPVK
jgi:hypothetical protein